MLKGVKKGIIFLLSISTVISTTVCYAETNGNSAVTDAIVENSVSVETGDYEEYVTKGDFKNSDKKISVEIQNYTSQEANVAIDQGVIDWTDGNGRGSFRHAVGK